MARQLQQASFDELLNLCLWLHELGGEGSAADEVDSALVGHELYGGLDRRLALFRRPAPRACVLSPLSSLVEPCAHGFGPAPRSRFELGAHALGALGRRNLDFERSVAPFSAGLFGFENDVAHLGAAAGSAVVDEAVLAALRGVQCGQHGIVDLHPRLAHPIPAEYVESEASDFGAGDPFDDDLPAVLVRVEMHDGDEGGADVEAEVVAARIGTREHYRLHTGARCLCRLVRARQKRAAHVDGDDEITVGQVVEKIVSVGVRDQQSDLWVSDVENAVAVEVPIQEYGDVAYPVVEAVHSAIAVDIEERRSIDLVRPRRLIAEVAGKIRRTGSEGDGVRGLGLAVVVDASGAVGLRESSQDTARIGDVDEIVRGRQSVEFVLTGDVGCCGAYAVVGAGVERPVAVDVHIEIDGDALEPETGLGPVHGAASIGVVPHEVSDGARASGRGVAEVGGVDVVPAYDANRSGGIGPGGEIQSREDTRDVGHFDAVIARNETEEVIAAGRAGDVGTDDVAANVEDADGDVRDTGIASVLGTVAVGVEEDSVTDARGRVRRRVETEVGTEIVEPGHENIASRERAVRGRRVETAGQGERIDGHTRASWRQASYQPRTVRGGSGDGGAAAMDDRHGNAADPDLTRVLDAVTVCVVEHSVTDGASYRGRVAEVGVGVAPTITERDDSGRVGGCTGESQARGDARVVHVDVVVAGGESGEQVVSEQVGDLGGDENVVAAPDGAIGARRVQVEGRVRDAVLGRVVDTVPIGVEPHRVADGSGPWDANVSEVHVGDVGAGNGDADLVEPARERVAVENSGDVVDGRPVAAVGNVHEHIVSVRVRGCRGNEQIIGSSVESVGPGVDEVDPHARDAELARVLHAVRVGVVEDGAGDIGESGVLVAEVHVEVGGPGEKWRITRIVECGVRVTGLGRAREYIPGVGNLDLVVAARQRVEQVRTVRGCRRRCEHAVVRGTECSVEPRDDEVDGDASDSGLGGILYTVAVDVAPHVTANAAEGKIAEALSGDVGGEHRHRELPRGRGSRRGGQAGEYARVVGDLDGVVGAAAAACNAREGEVSVRVRYC